MRLLIPTLLSTLLSSYAQPAAKPPDDSGEAVVVEQLATTVAFARDGTWTEDRSARIRIQSEAGVQQLGVLTFPYSADTDRLDIVFVRVNKTDGRSVSTPEASVQDLTAEVARDAPTYSDAREKQIPVKSLGIGDVLEWKIRTVHAKAEVPGQFWYSHDFAKDIVVLEETLRITFPSTKNVKVSSPDFNPDISQDGDRKVYLWKTSHRPVRDDEKKQPAAESKVRPAVQLTTFLSWEDVGEWYSALQKNRVAVTPAIRAKAAEVTAGLKTDAERQRAIYQYVSMKFRYISISFGEGRYQPHTADEVLANQYGDCKDKHTLLAALLRAVGIEAWPVLIGAGIELDTEVPSPAQFNHLITYLPGGGSPTWLDSTPEMASFGMLQFGLRDQRALLMPDNGPARLVTTPAALPFPAVETLTAATRLSNDGTLTGHFDLSVKGDTEVFLRGAFHQTAPAQWLTLAKNMVANMGYGGTVQGLDVENLENLDAPFHFSWDYERKNFPDWANHRVSVPLPPFSVWYSENQEKPKKATEIGPPVKTTYHATVQLPEGYSVELPADVKLECDAAEYRATYSAEKGVLTAERVLTMKASKVQVSQWDAWHAFAKGLTDDEDRLVQLMRADSGAAPRVTRDSPEALELLQKAWQALQSRDLNSARDALAQAERINPQQSGLWAMKAGLYGIQNQVDKAIDALQKEIEYHPGNEAIYRVLAVTQRQAGRNEDALDTLRKWVKAAPGDADALQALSSALIDEKRYDEAADASRDALKNNPDNVGIEVELVKSLVRGGKKQEGLAAIAKVREHSPDAHMLNEVAWALVDSGMEPGIAKEMSLQAVEDFEKQLKDVTLESLNTDQLKVIDSMGATWDTVGWAYYLLGDSATAEKYLDAAWKLLQHPGVADHLGQLYEKRGKKQEAIHMYRLALAAKHDLPETRTRLEKLGGSDDSRPTLRRGAPAGPPQIPPEEELSKLRTTPIASLTQKDGSAEFFLLFTSKGLEDVRFIRGDDVLKPAAGVLAKTHFDMPFPDGGPERIPRRGILSCSGYTKPACNLVLLLPANTTR